MLNKVMLIGNLGRDPELRRTQQQGHPVANFTVATNRRWRDRDGERQEHTEWHYVVCFGRLAEIVGELFSRGRQVYIEGRLRTTTWADRETGEKRYRTEVLADAARLLGRREDSARPSGSESAEAAEEYGGGDATDDDIPF